MSDIKTVFGIDLGTTYSAISYIDEHGVPVVIKNMSDDGLTVMPSVVLIEDKRIIVDGIEKQNTVVGIEAKRSAITSPDRVFEEIKGRMGDVNYIPMVIDGVCYKPELVSSIILKKIAEYAFLTTGIRVEDVVITVPAYFNETQRVATRIAGELAGLNVLDILNEPTAAALCYGMDKGQCGQTVLVYDLGGGTFDITVIRIEDNADIRVLVTEGNPKLGGRRWDEVIINYVADVFEQEHAIDPLKDPVALQDLWIRCEDAKKSLSNKLSTMISVTCGARSTIELTREKFDELTAHLLENTISLTRTLLDQAKDKHGVDAVDTVLLVGGSSKMPQIARAIVSELGLEPKLYDPEEAVAKGAAIMGLKMITARTGDDDSESVSSRLNIPPSTLTKISDMTITNVNSHGIGVVFVSDRISMAMKVAVMIQAQTPLPSVSSREFCTIENNQDSADITVMELKHSEPVGVAELEDCERKNPEGNVLSLPAGLPIGSPITITFTMDEQGMLRVRAEDASRTKVIEFEIERIGVMNTSEQEQAHKDALTINVS